MIIENGTLQVVEKTGGGMVNGKPVPVVETVGSPIPCNMKTLQDNKRGKTIDSVFTQSSYEVLVDTLAIPHFTADKIILTDNRGVVKGTFRVQDIQHLDEVQAVKITV